ncbi:MAG: hypothetical protein EB150_09960 [Nitrososphaeria archaeon]|nr:hypothetical protein [Nitrososphaeria archaeon]
MHTHESGLIQMLQGLLVLIILVVIASFPTVNKHICIIFVNNAILPVGKSPLNKSRQAAETKCYFHEEALPMAILSFMLGNFTHTIPVGTRNSGLLISLSLLGR